MKILYISDVYFPRINGVSTSIATFRRELRARGHTVHLIAPDYFAPGDDESDILRVPARSLPMDPEDRLMRYGWALRHLDRLHAERYDLIHVQTPFVAHYLGLRLAEKLGIPCVETYHTFFEEYFYHYIPFLPKSWLKAAARRLSRMQGNRLDAMVVPSRPMLDVLRQYGVNTRAEVIPTGLQPASFAPGYGAVFRQKYGIAQDRPVLLFVGRVAHEKNIGFLLQVLDHLRRTMPQALMVIAGEGPALAGLESDVERMGLHDHVQFIGYLDRHTELNSCYAAGDVFVFASRTETQGLVLLEAMAQGLAVVSTAEMGTRDVLREGLGVHIAAEDVAAFSVRVAALLEDREAREALGREGRTYAQSWSAGSMTDRMLAFYQQTLQGHAVQRASAPQLAAVTKS